MDDTEPTNALEPPGNGTNMFSPSDQAEQEAKRLARRRIALIGVGTGAVMAVLMLLCVLLLYLAISGNS